jgi:hypothetical protein
VLLAEVPLDRALEGTNVKAPNKRDINASSLGNFATHLEGLGHLFFFNLVLLQGIK